jgi:AcrR family transcriptional regulator
VGNSSSSARLPRHERERQILDAAHALFAERGYEAVTMDVVAAEVGVTKPLLYAYFGNKERLYLACMRRAGDAMLAVVVEAVTAAEDPADALRRGLHAFFSFVDSDRDAWRVLFSETQPGSGEIGRQIAEYRERLTGLIAGARLTGVPADRREAAAPRVEALATALLGAAEALARWWLRTNAMPADEAADLLAGTLEPGLITTTRGAR